jgi:hypothetical protein
MTNSDVSANTTSIFIRIFACPGLSSQKEHGGFVFPGSMTIREKFPS